MAEIDDLSNSTFHPPLTNRASTSHRPSMAELLPADLMFEILLRLPVLSLLRFRCVCKGWRDLIDSPKFAKSHLNLPNRPPSVLVLRQDYDNGAYNAYDVVDLSSLLNGGPALALRENPFPVDGRSIHYVGDCNGLVCISDFTRGVLLWNPATRKHFLIKLPAQVRWFRNSGFCYDKDSNDYKIVAMVKNEATGAEGLYYVWIYSVRSRSWNRIDEFPFSLMAYDEAGVFVNGAFHWTVYRQEGEVELRMISALHLGKLEYSLVPVPDYNSENNDKVFEYLGEFAGCLCAGYYGRDCEGFELWTMNEYGVRESWTRLIRCATNGLKSSAYLLNDEVLFFTLYYSYIDGYECEFRTLSFRRGREAKMRSSGSLPGGYWPYVYVPSLVCPQNGCYAN